MSRDLDASVRAFKLQGLELAAIGDAYRRRIAGSSSERLAWLADGRLASMGYRSVSFWDLRDDRETDRFLTPHAPKAVSPDGSLFLLQTSDIGSGNWSDSPAWLWSPERGRIAELAGVFDLYGGFFPDGSFAATSRGRVFRFDRDGRSTAVFETPENVKQGVYPWFLNPFECFADGLIATIGHRVSKPSTMFVWDRDGRMRVRELPNGALSVLARSGNELLVACGASVERYDVETLESCGAVPLPARAPHPGGLGADDKGLAAPTLQGIVFLDFASGASCTAVDPPYSVSQLLMTRDGDRVVGTGIGSSIYVWDRRTGEEIAPIARHPHVSCISALPDATVAVGRQASNPESAVAVFHSVVDVFDGETLAFRRTIDGGAGGTVVGIAGRQGVIAGITWHGHVFVATPAGETFAQKHRSVRGAGVFWKRSGELVTLALEDYVVWDAGARKELQRVPRLFSTLETQLFERSWETETSEHPDELLAFAPSVSLGITTVFGDDRTETSWLFGEELRLEPFADKHAQAAAVAADGSWAVVSWGQTVDLVAPGETTPRATASFDGPVDALAISPDGRHWAAAQRGGRIEVRLGAAEAPAAFADLSGASDAASALVFLQDGSLAAGTRRGNVLRFRLLP